MFANKELRNIRFNDKFALKLITLGILKRSDLSYRQNHMVELNASLNVSKRISKWADIEILVNGKYVFIRSGNSNEIEKIYGSYVEPEKEVLPVTVKPIGGNEIHEIEETEGIIDEEPAEEVVEEKQADETIIEQQVEEALVEEDLGFTEAVNLSPELRKELGLDENDSIDVNIKEEEQPEPKVEETPVEEKIAGLEGAIVRGVPGRQKGETDAHMLARLVTDPKAGDVVVIRGKEYIRGTSAWEGIGEIVLDEDTEEVEQSEATENVEWVNSTQHRPTQSVNIKKKNHRH